MRGGRKALSLCVTLCALGVPPAGAQPVASVPAPASENRGLEAGAPPAANQRYLVGIDLYRKGEFSAAALEFRVALQLFPTSAKLSYNLARSLERSGALTEAIAEYRNYLALAPNAADRVDVERVIAALEAERDRREAARRAQQEAPPRGVVAAPTPVIRESRASSETRVVAAWTTAGLAVAAATGAVVFTLKARAASDDAAGLSAADVERHADLTDDHENASTWAWVLGGAATALAGTSGVLFAWPFIAPVEAGRPGANAGATLGAGLQGRW
jgi:tetratricopeptide (TPR) repeat protein